MMKVIEVVTILSLLCLLLTLLEIQNLKFQHQQKIDQLESMIYELKDNLDNETGEFTDRSEKDIRTVQGSLTKELQIMQRKYDDLIMYQNKTVETLYERLDTLKQDSTKEKVAFTAGMTASANNVTSLQRFVFPKVYYNIGNGYNPKTGVFTAPFTGIYIFYVAVLSQGTMGITMEIMVNGQATLTALGTSFAEYQTGTNLIARRLQKGNQVWVRQFSGTLTYGYFSYATSTTTFSGFLLFNKIYTLSYDLFANFK